MATARAFVRTARTSTRRRRTSPRQGPRAPTALADRMVIEAGLVVAAYTDRLMRALEPLLRERFGQRQDTSISEVFERVQEGELSREFLARMFRMVDQQAANDLHRAVPEIAADQTLRGAAQLQRGWVSRNTELIQLESRARAEVRGIIDGPLREGIRVEEVRKRIEERMEVVRSRAELIARDQTLKLYGQIQEARQTDAGIEEYTWSTSLDERVRSRHAELEGSVQRWDTPPVVDQRSGRRGHPGDDFQCRCSAIPILPTEGLPDEPPSTTRPRSLPPAPPAELAIELSAPANDVPRAAVQPPQPSAPPPPAPPPAAPPPPPPPPPSEPPSEPPSSSRRAAQAAAQQLAAERARQIGVAALDPQQEAAGRSVVLAKQQSLPRYDSQERTREEARRAAQPGGLAAKLPVVEAQSTRKHETMSAPQRDALAEYVTGNYRALRALDMGATPEEVLGYGLVASLAEAQRLSAQVPYLRGARQALVVRRPTQYGTLYRGINVESQAVLARLLTDDGLVFIGSVNSSSYHYRMARQFAESGPGTRIILEMPDVDKAVSAIYSANDLRHEAEMIIGKTKFRIVSRNYDPDTDTYLFKLEQISLTTDAADASAESKPRKPPPGVGDISKFISDGSDIQSFEIER